MSTRTLENSNGSSTFNITQNVTTALDDDSVTSAKILNGTITLEDCSTALQNTISGGGGTTYTAGTGIDLTNDIITVKDEYAKLTGTQPIGGSKTFTSTLYAQAGLSSSGLYLNGSAPNSTSSTLYNDSGTLKWNGAAVGGTLPTASTTVKGGIIVGQGLSVNPQTDVLGMVEATTSSAGVVQVGQGLSVNSVGMLSVADDYVKLTGNQSIGGTKTFSGPVLTSSGVYPYFVSFPQVTPNAGLMISHVSKLYNEGGVLKWEGNVITPTDYVSVTGNQSIAGNKSFTSTSCDFDQALSIKSSSSSGGQLNLYGSNSTQYSVIFRAPALSSNWTLTLPTSAGSFGQVLQTNGSNQTSWVWPANSYTLPTAGNNTLGGVKVNGGGLTLSSTGVLLNTDENKTFTGSFLYNNLDVNNTTVQYAIQPYHDNIPSGGSTAANTIPYLNGYGIKIQKSSSRPQDSLTFGTSSHRWATVATQAVVIKQLANTISLFGGSANIQYAMMTVNGSGVHIGSHENHSTTKIYNNFEVQGDGSSTDGKIKLNCSQNSHGVTIASPPHAAGASYELVLPTSLGTTGQVLTTNADTGQTSWTTPTATVPETLTNITNINGKSVAMAANYSGGSVLMNNSTSTRTASSEGTAHQGQTSAQASHPTDTGPNGAYDGWAALATPYASEWCQIDIGSTKYIAGIWIGGRNHVSAIQYCTEVKLEFWDSSSSSWVVIQNGSSNTWATNLSSSNWPHFPASGGGSILTFNSAIQTSKVRIFPVAVPTGGYWILRWDLYEAQGTPAYTSKNIDVDGSFNLSHAEANSGTPTAYSLKATSNITTSAGIYASSTTTTSDDRIKFNEVPVGDCMTTLDKLEPMYYEKIMTIPAGVTGNWMPSDADWPNVKSQYDYGHEYGFVAQSVRDIPELSTLVKGSGFDGNGTQAPLSLDYNSIIPITVGALKELNERINILESLIHNNDGPAAAQQP